MYVVLVNYTAPLEEIDYVLADHVSWLTKHYDNNHFLASGRRNPRSGSVIITRPMPRGKLDAILATDPFALQHLATHEVIEFAATRTCHELQALNEALAE